MSALFDLLSFAEDSDPDTQAAFLALVDNYRSQVLYEAADTVRYLGSEGTSPSTVVAILCTMAEDGLQ